MKTLKEKRLLYGISQKKLASETGISRQYLNEIESGSKKPSIQLLEKLKTTLERFNPESPLELLIDYVRVRFPTQDIRYVVEEIMQFRFEQLIHEDYAFYSYSEQYYFGDMVLMTSPVEEKGILLELKGKGCRQFEYFLLAQNRTWYDFLIECLKNEAVFKRVDLAINDKVGLLDIPELTDKCHQEECVSVFRSFKSYRSGELVQSREKDKLGMGNTLYIGSLKSEVYFCIYEKDYEQYVKNGIPIEETMIKNRFEIRLKNEHSHHAVLDLLAYRDAERTAFSIINRYVRFVDKEENKRRSDWKMNEKWLHFIGENKASLKLTTQPEPFTMDRTLAWLNKQVAPTLKMMMTLDEVKETKYISTMLEEAKLNEKHIKIMSQQLLEVDDLIKKK